MFYIVNCAVKMTSLETHGSEGLANYEKSLSEFRQTKITHK